RARDQGARAKRRVHDPVAPGEALHRRGCRGGFDLAFDVALLVALAWRCDGRASSWRPEHRLRDVGQEAAWKRRLRAAIEVAAKRAAQVEPVLRARHSYICEAPLLGHVGRRPDELW